jgi:hypothetical protein
MTVQMKDGYVELDLHGKTTVIMPPAIAKAHAEAILKLLEPK